MTGHVLACGGGGMQRDERWRLRPGPLLEHALQLSGTEAPRVCGVFTAVGDDAATIADWYAAFADRPERVSHLALLPMPNVDDLRAHVLAHDVVWVWGGSVAGLMALWRLHGLDEVLREAHEAGVVLAGVSAGALCWTSGGTTDSYGPRLRAWTDGLRLVEGSTCPHYDSEGERRPLYRRLVAEGVLEPGLAADDGVGLHYVDGRFTEAVADRDGAAAERVDADGERRLPVRRLG